VYKENLTNKTKYMKMNTSNVGELFKPTNDSKEIKRRRKIQYRKPKGRLLQKASGILNKSVCTQNLLLNQSKSLHESRCNQSQLVSVQNINSFLEKNKQLAKALEEARSNMKELQNQKFTCQMECNEMREKISIFQNTILRCICKQDNTKSQPIEGSNNDMDILNHVESNLKATLSSLNHYITSIALNKCSVGAPRHQISPVSISVSSESDCSSSCNKAIFKKLPKIENLKPKPLMVNKKVQTSPISYAAKTPVLMKHKKVQVNIRMANNTVNEISNRITTSDKACQMENKVLTRDKGCQIKNKENNAMRTKGYVINRKTVDKECQVEKSIDSKEQATQCLLMNNKIVNNKIMNNKIMNNKIVNNADEKRRRPLAEVDPNTKVVKEMKSILKPQKEIKTSKTIPSLSLGKSSKKFEIYEDNPENYKENDDHALSSSLKRKTVTIYSPAQIKIFSDENFRLRRRNRYVDYRESSRAKKLSRNEANVDTRFHTSPHSKGKRRYVKKKGKKMNRSINLEELINSVLEESFLTILNKP